MKIRVEINGVIIKDEDVPKSEKQTAWRIWELEYEHPYADVFLWAESKMNAWQELPYQS